MLRIFPAYWLALTGVALWLGADYVFTGEGVLRYYGLLQVYDSDTITNGIGQAWTVCIEITFYLLLPVWAITARRRPWTTDRGFARSELVPLAVAVRRRRGVEPVGPRGDGGRHDQADARHLHAARLPRVLRGRDGADRRRPCCSGTAERQPADRPPGRRAALGPVADRGASRSGSPAWPAARTTASPTSSTRTATR